MCKVSSHICKQFFMLIVKYDNGNVGLHVCAEFHDHTYAVLYAHSKV